MLKEFECKDCGKNTFHNEYYMVNDDIWHKCVPDKKGMLCIACLESRLGRELNAEDFPDVGINKLDSNCSELLMKRRGKNG